MTGWSMRRKTLKKACSSRWVPLLSPWQVHQGDLAHVIVAMHASMHVWLCLMGSWMSVHWTCSFGCWGMYRLMKGNVSCLLLCWICIVKCALQKERVNGRVPPQVNPLLLGQNLREKLDATMQSSGIGEHVEGAVSSFKRAVRRHFWSSFRMLSCKIFLWHRSFFLWHFTADLLILAFAIMLISSSFHPRRRVCCVLTCSTICAGPHPPSQARSRGRGKG